MRRLRWFLLSLFALSPMVFAASGASQTFNNTTSHVAWSTNIQGGSAITVFCWFKAATRAANDCLGGNEQSDSAGKGWNLGGNASGVMFMGCFSTGYPASTFIGSSNTYTTTGWHSAGGRFDDANNTIDVWLDGTKTSQSDTNSCLNSTTTWRIGHNQANGGRWDGQIAYFAVWDVVLTDAEMQSLSAGVMPETVRSSSLQRFVPLWINGQNFGLTADTNTDANLTVSADGPPVFVPSGN